MSGHTPGPWVVKATMVGAAASVKIIGKRGGDLSDQDVVCMVPQTNDEQFANGQLILAAPDLLAVVCEMLGAAETDALDDKSNVWRSAMIEARAAIAKVEVAHG